MRGKPPHLVFPHGAPRLAYGLLLFLLLAAGDTVLAAGRRKPIRGGWRRHATDDCREDLVYGHRASFRRARPADATSGPCRLGRGLRAHRPPPARRSARDPQRRDVHAPRHDPRARRRHRRHRRAPARGAVRARHRQRAGRGGRARDPRDGRQLRVLRLPDPRRRHLRPGRTAPQPARAPAGRGPRRRPPDPDRAVARPPRDLLGRLRPPGDRPAAAPEPRRSTTRASSRRSAARGPSASCGRSRRSGAPASRAAATWTTRW